MEHTARRTDARLPVSLRLFWIVQLVFLTALQAAHLKPLIPVTAENQIVADALRDTLVLGLCGLFFLTSFAMILLKFMFRMWSSPSPAAPAMLEAPAAAA